MELACLLAEIRRRARVLPPRSVNPLTVIRQRCAEAPDSLENQRLAKVAATIVTWDGDFDENEVAMLGAEALGLLDALIERMIGQVGADLQEKR